MVWFLCISECYKKFCIERNDTRNCVHVLFLHFGVSVVLFPLCLSDHIGYRNIHMTKNKNQKLTEVNLGAHRFRTPKKEEV